eukprot:CAMPEP_0196136932 /NCGR_PEP_ID=MMETSP0910-20130528/5068_1 /TAXON_ID=49265 /ORGANISM="Thalassiosira rotula, Strain GSO102" /LENGTH=449 /DNA_ID=CAMNT_0041397299 /DNA_START=12 /DNA_END=1362 /DNA_ORIENTATION=+
MLPNPPTKANFTRNILLLSVFQHFSSVARSDPNPWKQWTCDELTPNLCDLQVETGTLVLRSIPVKYWRYTRQSEDSFNNESTITIPIIAVHGGPSWPHNYMLPLKQLACRGTEVIFYDQAGCGESVPEERGGAPVSPSDHPHLLDTSYYSEEELPALIDHWGLDAYHVLGSSWGTILAQLFALNADKERITTGGRRRRRRRLQSLVLSGPLSDAQSYIAAKWDPAEGNNLGSLPPFSYKRANSLAASARSVRFGRVQTNHTSVVTSFFTLRTAPAPDLLHAFSAEGDERGRVYVGMQGGFGVYDRWRAGGTLTSRDDCTRSTYRVLLTHGKYDTMRPSIVETMEERLKLAERVMLPHSGHVSMIDDAGMMNDVVADFLQRVEVVVNRGDGLDLFVPRREETDEEGGEILDNDSLDTPWKSVVIAFVAGVFGVVIGRAYGNGNNGAYARI